MTAPRRTRHKNPRLCFTASCWRARSPAMSCSTRFSGPGRPARSLGGWGGGVKGDAAPRAPPTQKPEALLYRILLACTKPGDVVLDPFFGTGTTGAVARRLGRCWIGIEREPAYVKVARERIASTLPLDESAMQTVPDKREQPRVAFGVLVESGLVPAGTALIDAKRRWSAAVRADGSITCENHAGSIHKVGAALQVAPSCNGWTFWHVEQGGTLTLLD